MDQKRFERVLQRAFWIPLVFGILLASLLVGEVQYLIGRIAWVEHTDQVISQAELIYRNRIDQETGLRAYILTGDKAFLEPFYSGRRAVESVEPRLRQLISDNPDQVRRLDQATAAFQEWMKWADTALARRDTAQSVEFQLRGKQLMDTYRRTQADFVDRERQLRQERLDRSRNTLNVVHASIIALSVVFALGFAFLGRRQLTALARSFNERTVALASTVKELEAFSYSVSHDLRAPLRSLDGFSQALLEDYENVLDDDGKQYLRRIRANSQRMGLLIDDLLQLSRITRKEVASEDVDLSSQAREIVEELQSREPERRVRVEITPGLSVRGDASLLRIALGNLIGNAWKFTGKRPDARIQFGSTVADGATAYFVRDNGAGFDMKHANKLFAAFQRLHQTYEFEGTGIGLATVQRIIRKHGGRAWGEGAVNEGATFYFTLHEKRNS